MPNQPIVFPANFATVSAMAFTDAAGGAQLVSAGSELPVTGPLTDVQLRAAPIAVTVSGGSSSGGLTDSQLRAAPLPVSGTFFPATQPVSIAGTVSTTALTDTQLRATALPVSLTTLPAGTNALGSVLVPETTFWNDSTTVLAASATFTGTARDVGVASGTVTTATYFNASFFADQAGTVSIEVSNDNTTWRQIASAALAVSTPAILSVPVMTRFHRVKLVNGATLQGLVMINSSYTGA